MHRVVVLGGGAGGLPTANRLARHAQGGTDLEVVLVDRADSHVFAPGFVAVMFGDAEPEAFRRPLASLARPGVRLVRDVVEAVDPRQRTVRAGRGPLEYDSLVVALGAEVGWPDGPPLGEETAPWTPEGAEGGRALLGRLSPADRVLVATAGPTYRCPPAVFDLAVRLAGRTGARVTLAHPWPHPLAPFGDEPARRAAAMLDAAEVAYRGGFELAALEPGLATPAEGEPIAFDAAVVVPPHRPPSLVADAGLGGPGGWMSVTYPALTHPAHPEVHGVGDVVAPALGVGMAGTLGVLEGAHVADRIAAAVAGDALPGHPHLAAICFLDTGETGSFLHCDFSGPATGTGPARCALMPEMSFFRKAKALFAEEWFSTTLSGEVS